MTESLKNAFAEVSKLPDEQQNAFAEWIIQELESEQRWTQSFEQSQDILEALADEALKEFHEGKTHELDWDNLE